MKRLAIVGFGGAGYNAAKAARSVSPDAEIDVYTDTDVGPYNPMLTTYYVKNAFAYDTLFPFGALEEIAQSLRLNIHTGCPVTGLLAQERAVELANGTRRRYDSILLSTGASALMPPIPGIDLPGVLKMRTAADARLLKERIETGGLKDALVVGASWVGIKVIEDFYEKGIACTLVDGAKWIFPVAAFRETAQRIQADLDRKSVRQAYGQMLERIEREPDGRLAACMKGGERFSADTVVVCIGIRPNVGFLKGSGLEIGRAVRVDRKQQTNIPGIYAAGDCAEFGGRVAGLWSAALAQGRTAGLAMAGAQAEYSPIVPATALEDGEFKLFSAGAVGAKEHKRILLDDPASRVYKALYFDDDKLCGAVFLTDVSGAAAAMDAIEKAMARDMAMLLLL